MFPGQLAFGRLFVVIVCATSAVTQQATFQLSANHSSRHSMQELRC